MPLPVRCQEMALGGEKITPMSPKAEAAFVLSWRGGWCFITTYRALLWVCRVQRHTGNQEGGECHRSAFHGFSALTSNQMTCLITAEKDSPILIIRLSGDLTSLALYPKRKEISHFPSYFSYINQLLKDSSTGLRTGTKATVFGLRWSLEILIYKVKI